MMLDPEISKIGQERPGEIARLPRRQFLEVSNDDATLSQMRFVSFEVNRIHSVGRLFTWLRLLIYFTFNLLVDSLLGRDSPEKRAVWLRRAFERNDASFIKLGLHLSIRFDLFPWVYCNELSRMVDRMQPFPLEQAIATIERSTSRPLAAIFALFDPEPIASTSVACIYQAQLHTGEKVIVKVRRPGIGEQFMAEIQAFDWLLSIAEFLTIFRPGFTQGMRDEIRSSLLEELDFIQEARRQDAFRRAAEKSRKSYFSAPRIYLNLTGEEVVVEEFASGLWLWELMAAVEQGNETILARAQEMNINPKKVAKRLLWVNYWAWSENLFFHANPQPYNIIIGQDSKLYFINFTITGSLSRSKRQALRQNLYYAWRRDPQNMARSFLILMEPLPPIDLIELTQELETYNWQLLYALEAAPESLTWQERTSAIQWIGMIQLARKYGIAIDMHVLLQMRSTLLCESIAVRLHHNIDFVRQYRKFNRYVAEQTRRRLTDSILDQLEGKTNEQLIIGLDRLADTLQGIFFRTRHMLSLPSLNFRALMSKWSYAVYILVRFLALLLGITILAVILSSLNIYFGGVRPVSALAVFQSVITNPVYQIIVLILIISSGRTVLFRMDDKEV